MNAPPKDIIEVVLVNEKTGDKILLTKKKDSYCHFVPDDKRHKFGAYEIRFRLDWKDRTTENDPKLDADLFNTDGNQIRDKRLRQIILGSLHHTSRNFDVYNNKYIYQLGNNLVSFEFTTQLTIQANQPGTARIIEEL